MTKLWTTCRSCRFYKRIYEQFNLHYVKCNKHYCTNREELISTKNGCDNWSKRKKEFDLSSERLLKVEEDIKMLIDYFGDL